MSKGYVWVVDDDSSIRWVLEKTLTSANIQCETFTDAHSVLSALERQVPDVLISDIRMVGMDGLTLLKQLHKTHPELPVIIMTAHSDLDAAVNAYQKGAFEYLPKPFDIDETLTLVERALTHRFENSNLAQKRQNIDNVADTIPEILGEAPAMQELFRAIGRLSRSSISVLINGESGTGKELVAQALHRHSPRSQKPFIALNMAAIPKDLIESELFGHEKGAFTGANSVRQGRFEQANGGTLFLDEIGDMPLEIQTRLLRVLADGQFYRVGGHAAVQVDVRIIAATHQHLEQLVNQGSFREDLFHRLNVIRIKIPALRERRQDIATLAIHFLAKAADEMDVDVKSLHPQTIEYLNQLPWQGNVRQLENTCRWLTVMASGSEVLPGDLPPELLNHLLDDQTAKAPHDQTVKAPYDQIVNASHERTTRTKINVDVNDNMTMEWQKSLALWAKNHLVSGGCELLSIAQPEFEKILLEAALAHTKGHKQEAAKLLGWGRNTLTRKLKELGIH